MAAMGATHLWVTECATALNKEKTEATKVVCILVRREEPPEELVRLDRTSPIPTMIDGEASYCVLRTEFSAIKKINIEVSDIEVINQPDGQYNATIKALFGRAPATVLRRVSRSRSTEATKSRLLPPKCKRASAPLFDGQKRLLLNQKVVRATMEAAMERAA